MPKALKLADAARVLKKHPATLRRWVARGAPTVNGPGEVGRGKGPLVDLDALVRWKAGDLSHLDDVDQLRRLAVALLDTFKRDCGSGEPAHVRLDIEPRKAAGLLVLAYQRCWQNMTGQSIDDLSDLPQEIAQLCAVFTE